MSTPPAGAWGLVCVVTLHARTPPIADQDEVQPGRTPAFRAAGALVSLASPC